MMYIERHKFCWHNFNIISRCKVKDRYNYKNRKGKKNIQGKMLTFNLFLSSIQEKVIKLTLLRLIFDSYSIEDQI